MKKILLTGSSGFVGGNILPFLKDKYIVSAPNRKELDLRNPEMVREYLADGKFDVVIHFASPSPIRSAHLDRYDTLFEDSLRIFMNFYSVRNTFGKMIYSGSGAEFDKRRDIVSITEEQIGECIPHDAYGFSKYIINELAQQSNNIFNLRIFACYGPGEYKSKFITHAIRCCLEKKNITIRQDCYFDYLYIEDYVRYLLYFIDNAPKFHDYNAVSGQPIKLSTIAEIVNSQLGNPRPVQIMTKGMNREYTASNKRIVEETGIDNLIPIESGVSRLIKWERENETTCC